MSTLFATFLGNNPIEHLLSAGGTLDQLSAPQRATLTGHAFFPRLVSGPFHHGLTVVFGVAAAMALVAAFASALRGGHRRLPDTARRGHAPAPTGPAQRAGAPRDGETAPDRASDGGTPSEAASAARTAPGEDARRQGDRRGR
ncbi:hypothetical protein [Streptomyces sennicomposti]